MVVGCWSWRVLVVVMLVLLLGVDNLTISRSHDLRFCRQKEKQRPLNSCKGHSWDVVVVTRWQRAVPLYALGRRPLLNDYTELI
jgi:hypothetical protein